MPTIKYISLWGRRPFAPPIPTVRERPRREDTPTLLAEDLSDEPDEHEAPEEPFLESSSSRYSNDAELLTSPQMRILWDDVNDTLGTAAASSVPGPQAGQRSSSGLMSAHHTIVEENSADSVSVYSSDEPLYRYHIVPPDDVSETIEDDVGMRRKKRCICRRIYKRVVEGQRRQKPAAKRAGSALKQMVKRLFSRRIQI